MYKYVINSNILVLLLMTNYPGHILLILWCPSEQYYIILVLHRICKQACKVIVFPVSSPGDMYVKNVTIQSKQYHHRVNRICKQACKVIGLPVSSPGDMYVKKCHYPK